jgi:sec-independent protein translocase protein TatB
MFDSIGFQELFLIGLVALLVVGPKELPVLMRKGGQFMNKMRGMAADFRATFDEMARQSELDELRKEVEALRNNNPLQDIRDELTKPLDTQTYPPAIEQEAEPVMTPLVEASDTAEAPVKRPRKTRAKKVAADTPA